MKLRKCRKCKTIPILKSEMIYMQQPRRSNELIDPVAEFHLMLNIEPTKRYYYECECKRTRFCPTEEDAFKAWNRRADDEPSESM